jgi:hypothetical protein
MKADSLTRVLLLVVVCLLVWDIFCREVRPVQAQGAYTVVRLGNSPSDWTSRLNENGKKLVAVVPVQSNGLEHQNSFLLILQ